MQNGICPKCQSTEVYMGISKTTTRDVSLTVMGVPLMPQLYICGVCGYMEEYCQDEQFLENMKQRWKKIPTK